MADFGNLVTTTGTGTTGAAIPETSDTLLPGSVSNILNLQATATTDTAAATADTANATAATTSATGYTTEGESYQTSADIAAQNAVTAQLAGQVTNLQEARTMRTTSWYSSREYRIQAWATMTSGRSGRRDTAFSADARARSIQAGLRSYQQ